jgi:hypothetical protein
MFKFSSTFWIYYLRFNDYYCYYYYYYLLGIVVVVVSVGVVRSRTEAMEFSFFFSF